MTKNCLTIYILLILAVLGMIFLGIICGSIPITFNDFLALLTPGADIDPVIQTIILQIRVPRVLAAVLGGAALSLAGLLLQIFFRNQIIDSFVLGIASGSSFMVGLVMLLGINFGWLSGQGFSSFIAALFGAFAIMVLMLFLARHLRELTSLLVIGLIIGYLCSAGNSFLIAFAEKEQLRNFIHWSLGSFSMFSWSQLQLLALISIPTLILATFLGKPLNGLSMGEDYAQSIGINLKRLRTQIIIITGILVAIVTAYAGPIAFIGLAVPHLARLLFRTADNRILLNGTMLLGGLITALCDLLARLLLAPIELPLTAVTSCFGAPLVIYLILKRRACR